MRFLYLTDTQGRGNSPQSRRDDFLATLEAKLREVVEIALEYRVDAILHGGDFFDIPNPSLPVAWRVIAPFWESRIPVYGVGGNHDFYGYNPETLPRTVLGFLGQLGAVRLLLPGRPVYFDDGNVRVQVTGQHYHYDIDRRDRRFDYWIKKNGCDVAIHIVHGMVVERALAPGVPFTTPDQILDTEADITLCGHNHLGFPDVAVGGKYILNPGALVRLTANPADIARHPQVLLIDLDGGISYRKIRLKSAPEGEDVIDRSAALEAELKARKFSEFVQNVKDSGEFKTVDIGALIQEIAGRKSLPGKVRERALKIISDVQEGMGEGALDA
ncbi:MAG TPA: serine/threonine protein phosphatase [Firmicutes bacterium]|nr:serine/threonine protein phosphatase [Bacillota bacterium]